MGRTEQSLELRLLLDQHALPQKKRVVVHIAVCTGADPSCYSRHFSPQELQELLQQIKDLQQVLIWKWTGGLVLYLATAWGSRCQLVLVFNRCQCWAQAHLDQDPVAEGEVSRQLGTAQPSLQLVMPACQKSAGLSLQTRVPLLPPCSQAED